MQFHIKGINKSTNDIMRTIGYRPAYFQNEGEVSIVRQLGRNDYPRFHLYIKRSFVKVSEEQMQAKDCIFSLHLDQKKPSYGGSHAHSGEYEGALVQEEAERINSLLKK